MKVIIGGSRSFNDYNYLLRVCFEEDVFLYAKEIVSGGARGADSLGERYATEHGIKITKFPADWEKYGKAAGYKRNAEMAKYADKLIAFWDGQSKGTKHMIDLAKENNLRVVIKKVSREI